jgi:arylsulfatase A
MPDLSERFVFDFIDRHKDGPFYVHYSLAHIHTDILPTPDSKPNSEDLFSDNVAYMDKLVGRLMAELDRQGLREKTLVAWVNKAGETLPPDIKPSEVEGGVKNVFPDAYEAPSTTPAWTRHRAPTTVFS